MSTSTTLGWPQTNPFVAKGPVDNRRVITVPCNKIVHVLQSAAVVIAESATTVNKRDHLKGLVCLCKHAIFVEDCDAEAIRKFKQPRTWRVVAHAPRVAPDAAHRL